MRPCLLQWCNGAHTGFLHLSQRESALMQIYNATATTLWLTGDICEVPSVYLPLTTTMEKEGEYLKDCDFKTWCRASQWCLLRNSRTFCLSQTFGARPGFRLMNSWSVASSSNLHSPSTAGLFFLPGKTQQSCESPTSSPSDHLSLIYRCQWSSEEEHSLHAKTKKTSVPMKSVTFFSQNTEDECLGFFFSKSLLRGTGCRVHECYHLWYNSGVLFSRWYPTELTWPSAPSPLTKRGRKLWSFPFHLWRPASVSWFLAATALCHLLLSLVSYIHLCHCVKCVYLYKL